MQVIQEKQQIYSQYKVFTWKTLKEGQKNYIGQSLEHNSLSMNKIHTLKVYYK